MVQPKENENEPRPFTVAIEAKNVSCNRTGEGPVRLIFTHGAGGTITSDSIAHFSGGFSKIATSSIVCFQGNMNLKSRTKMFNAVHDNVIHTYRHETPIALGGRSMGARAAVLAAMDDTKHLILVSYPLHTDREVRDQILLDLPADKEVLFVSGDHDSMCDLDRLQEVRRKMRARSWLVRVRNADHGMNVKPKKATMAVGEQCGILAAEWLHKREEGKTEREVWWGEEDQGEDAVHSGTWQEVAEPNSKEKTEVKSDGDDRRAIKETRTMQDAAETRGKTESMPARTKNIHSTAKNGKENQEAIAEPATEPRRSKRRKTKR